jgi:hypothetical protein
MFARHCIALALLLGACAKARSEPRVGIDLRQNVLVNRAAYIPPQCFTRVLDPGDDRVHNPCYVCHGEAHEPNQEDQLDLQLAYDFPQLRAGHEVTNDWLNLFVDRRAQVASITDAQVRAYVDRDNYLRAGVNLLRARLESLPAGWDGNDNGRWDGFTPDAHFAFDAQGFDRAPTGAATGWRTFAYHPLPGAFMPTNGAFDDVLIRLPSAFRQDRAGREDSRIYAVNLAIVEALIKRQDIPIDAIDERPLGIDLDRDGQLSAAVLVRYAWRPLQPDSMQYVGRAELEQRQALVHLAAGLFPEGTEFLHSVRYLAVDRRGAVVPAARMKELRYARKHVWLTYSDRADITRHEAKEAAQNPDRPERFLGSAEQGLHSAWGWTYQGWIEDATGELRPQSYEETVFCMGCHGGLSATTDGAFAYPRKLTSGPAHGFYAWSAGSPALPDPIRGDGQGEYATYLSRNSAGDEYRSNLEVHAKFFAQARPRNAMFERLARDVSTLLIPSSTRALALDKAYWSIVREQSFVQGRDALLAPATRVLREVRAGAPTGIREPMR